MQKCPICLEPLTSGSTNHTVTTPCGHLFHVNCVQDWIARGIQKCPKCLRNIPKDKLIRIYLEPSESDVQIPQETDENQQRSENSRWSKIANSVAYFSETNSVSLNSPSNSAGADNEISNPESRRKNPRTSNPKTTQNHLERANIEKRADSELFNPETTRSKTSRGNPTTTPVQYIQTNTFANADEMVVNTTRNYNPRLTRPTNNELECSDKQCCCFCFLFVCLVLLLVLLGFLT
jgi:hypothetical protein